jgi:hypothetical protein
MIEQIPTALAGRYKTDIVLNVIGAILSFLLIYAISFVAIFLINHKYAAIGAIGVVVAFGLIGYFSHPKSRDDDGSIIDCPWDIDTIGAYVANREILKVTGPAYIINEVVMAGSSCLRKIMHSFRMIKLVRGFNESEHGSIVRKLKAFANADNRFNKVTDVSSDFVAIKPLILSEVIWVKKQNGQVLIGLNRDYDKIK